jgi:hypothetical protein
MKIRSVALALFFLSMVACSRVAPGTGGIDLDEATSVRVDNRGFTDMTVYVARSSQRQRLGLAPGNTVTTFALPRNLVGPATPLRFVADPIGSSRASVSEEISVSPGDTVTLMIPPG